MSLFHRACKDAGNKEVKINSEALYEELDIFLPDFSQEDSAIPWMRQTSAASARYTWTSLTISVLCHVLLAVSLVFLGKPPAKSTLMDFPNEVVEVQLVTLAEAPGGAGSGADGGTPEIREQPAVSAPEAPAPIPPKTPPAARTTHAKISPVPVKKSVKPSPAVEPKIQAEAGLESPAPAAPPAPAAQEGGAGQGAVASLGIGTGPGDRPAGPGKNGPGGSGSLERSFGGPDGPQFLRRSMPSYPALAKRLDKEGTVLLRVTIDERGHAVAVEVVRGAGFGFDEEAVKAVKDSTFLPARREGNPVTCKAFLPIRFVLTGAGEG